MKKKILSVLAVLAAGFVSLTSCQDEKPFSIYQIGVNYPFVGNVVLSQDEIEALPPAEKDMFKAALYLNQWFFKNDFIRTGISGNPIVIEGADEDENDRQAYVIYENKLSELKKKEESGELDKIIWDAQRTNGTNGEPELTLTTTGSVIFSYTLTKGSNPSVIRTTSFTVDYGPLVVDEPAEPEL